MATETVTPPPGVDIRKLKAGTVILLEADCQLYEMEVRSPAHGLVEVSSTDPVLRLPTVGQLLYSLHRSGDGPAMPGWIGKGMVMEIRFRNGTYRSQPIVAARLNGRRDDGSGWSYDVF